jgi:hypothetical protein
LQRTQLYGRRCVGGQVVGADPAFPSVGEPYADEAFAALDLVDSIAGFDRGHS